MPKKVLESKKSYGGAQKMKKNVFLKNGPSHNLPKIKYVISEPHEDLLQWNLSWALTFDFLVHQEFIQISKKNFFVGWLGVPRKVPYKMPATLILYFEAIKNSKKCTLF